MRTMTMVAFLLLVTVFMGSGMTRCVGPGGHEPSPSPTESEATATPTGTPTAPTGILRIMGSGHKFGECLGNCWYELAFNPTTVSLTVSRYALTDVFTINSGTLTALGIEAVDLARAELQAAYNDLEPVYGCPDCADGGASWVDIDFSRQVTHHEYEFSNPPTVLSALDTMSEGLIEGLRNCTANTLVVPDGDCVTVP